MFIGEYTHTADDKKRISLPAKFRKELGAKVVVTRGLDNCLFLYTTKAWNSIAEKTSALGMMQADARDFTRYFFSGASEIEVDSAGRILIPETLCDFAGLKIKVVFTGVQDRIEIWNEKRWGEYKKRLEKDGERMAEKLGSVGMI